MLAVATVVGATVGGLHLGDVELPSLATATGEAELAPASDTDGSGIPVVWPPSGPEGATGAVGSGPTSPAEVEIPSIGVRSELSPLGLDDTGAMEAPSNFDTAGWFSLGPEPGQPGPAVIAGHVDSRDGPAVFYRLHELAAGDEVIVRRADGAEIRFTVTGVRSHPKTDFPTQAVYGPVPGSELRLITCGGDFDTSQRQYRENVVVYAVAAPG